MKVRCDPNYRPDALQFILLNSAVSAQFSRFGLQLASDSAGENFQVMPNEQDYCHHKRHALHNVREDEQ